VVDAGVAAVAALAGDVAAGARRDRVCQASSKSGFSAPELLGKRLEMTAPMLANLVDAQSART
jgi:hypothetical protein